MIVDQPVVLDNDQLSNITPDQVAAYLLTTGWLAEVVQREHALWWGRPANEEAPEHLRELISQRWRRWGGMQDRYFMQCMSLDLPTLGDYPNRMAELIIAVAVYENRGAVSVLEDIYSFDISAEGAVHSKIMDRLREAGGVIK